MAMEDFASDAIDVNLPAVLSRFYAIATAIWRGELEPDQISLLADTNDSAWLSRIEEDVFRSAYRAATAKDRGAIASEWAGYRILRVVTHDNAAVIAYFIHGPLQSTLAAKPSDGRLQALLSAFAAHTATLPRVVSSAVH
jgi:anti-sigma-K factor RskA